MKYKPDWDEAKNRMLAFWNHAVIDRCCIAVHAPKKGAQLPAFPDLQHGPWMGGVDELADDDTAGLKQWWINPELNYRRAIAWFENTYFGGEALPATYINWGAMALSALFGSPPEFNKTSVWYPRVIEDWDTWQWNPDPAGSPYWQTILAIFDRQLEGAQENYFVGKPELGNGADVLSLMRGMDQLAMDLILSPDSVKQGVEVISDAWVSLMEQTHQLSCRANQGGSVLAWMGLWAPGRTDQIACDFSSVISKAMFKEFFIPEIVKMGSWCEYGVYHLDGPACMKNMLDTLLEIPQIKVIQYTPGVGSAPTYTEAYIPRYKQILNSGRGLYLLVRPDEVEKIMAELPPEGLFMRTYVDTQEQAEDMLQKVVKWSASPHTFALS